MLQYINITCYINIYVCGYMNACVCVKTCSTAGMDQAWTEKSKILNKVAVAGTKIKIGITQAFINKTNGK